MDRISKNKIGFDLVEEKNILMLYSNRDVKSIYSKQIIVNQRSTSNYNYKSK